MSFREGNWHQLVCRLLQYGLVLRFSTCGPTIFFKAFQQRRSQQPVSGPKPGPNHRSNPRANDRSNTRSGFFSLLRHLQSSVPVQRSSIL